MRRAIFAAFRTAEITDSMIARAIARAGWSDSDGMKRRMKDALLAAFTAEKCPEHLWLCEYVNHIGGDITQKNYKCKHCPSTMTQEVMEWRP